VSQLKLVITDFTVPDNQHEEEELQASGLDIQLVRLNTRLPEELIPHVSDADGLLVQFTQITRQVIESLRKCRVISRYGIGVDMIDLEAATEHGIPVCNVPDFCMDEVSTHTIGFLLNLNRHILPHHLHVRSGNWGHPPGGAPARLPGQVLGVVGLGNIGRVVARRAKCLGLKVLASDPYLEPEQAGELGVELVELSDLLRQSDYVTLHCPLSAETHHLIGPGQLALMQPSAFLINMARGPIVDQAALYRALVDGIIAGAALDVLEQEPPAPDDPLLQLDNVLFTPHTSSWSAESIVQLRRDTARNAVDVFLGRTPRSVVNRGELG
jgi:D-3-phosphoglycerate dehydrogenase